MTRKFRKTLLRLHWPVVGVLTLAAGWAFHARWIAPLKEKESAHRLATAGLQERMAEARRAIEEVRELEVRKVSERHEIRALFANHPNDAAVIWFPERMKQHFERAGLGGAVTRLNTIRNEAELAGFERSYWAVELLVGPATKQVIEACMSVAEVESLDPSIRVLDVAIRPEPADPARRRMVMNVALLSRKAGGAR